MSRAVGYVRVSTDEQARENNSQAVQAGSIERYCKENRLTVAKLFIGSESARTMERPVLQEALTYCRNRRNSVTHFIVFDLSRLARNAGDQAHLLVTLQELGIQLVSINDPVTDDSAVGKLARTMLGAINQFFSDSLSERTRTRMLAAVKDGRFVWPAPIGYLNRNKQLHPDPDRAHLVAEAFVLMASGRYPTIDAVLKVVTALGLLSRRGRKLPKQSFSRMLQNPIYSGWVVSGDIRVRGKHTPLISDEVFEAVQERLGKKSVQHERVNEDFPLRGLVLCAACKRPLTAGWAKGRKERYPRYWCWTQGCRSVGISRDDLEGSFVKLLERMEPTAELIADLPNRIAAVWSERKARIASEASRLANKMAEQKSLNQQAVAARVRGDISQEELEQFKAGVAEEIQQIETQIAALDSEQATMQELMRQAERESVDLAAAWHKGNINQKQELVKAFFPEGLVFSHEKGFFEPANSMIVEMVWRYVLEGGHIGVPDGI